MATGRCQTFKRKARFFLLSYSLQMAAGTVDGRRRVDESASLHCVVLGSFRESWETQHHGVYCPSSPYLSHHIRNFINHAQTWSQVIPSSSSSSSFSLLPPPWLPVAVCIEQELDTRLLYLSSLVSLNSVLFFF